MSDSDFNEPRRQAALGVIILFAENLNKLIRVALALVVGSVFSQNINISIPLAAVIGAVVMAIYTILQYLRFKFHIEEEELILEKGVLQRERLTIPFDRIQTVHLKQNLVQRIVGLTGVSIDTAGSGGNELKISALSRADAVRLQSVLAGHHSAAAEESSVEGDEGIRGDIGESRLLMKIGIGTLALIGLTQNHIRNGIVALFVVGGYLNQFEDILYRLLGDRFTEVMDEMGDVESLLTRGLTIAVISIILFLLMSITISMVRTVLKHFGLEARLSDQHIDVVSGLLQRNEYRIPIRKIQLTKWNSNVLRRIPGFESLYIRQSRSQESDKKSSVEIPACYPDQRDMLMEALYGEGLAEDAPTFSPHAYFRLYATRIWSVLLAIPITALAILRGEWIWMMALPAGIALLWLLSGVLYRRISLRTDGRMIEYRYGWLSRDREILEIYKVQSARFSQSIFQKRRGVAHLKLYTAGGTLSLRFMPEDVMTELYDLILYKVETSEESWM